MKEEDYKSRWIEEMKKIQKEENESVERKELYKKELIECEALLKKCEDRRNFLKDQILCLGQKGLDLIKRRNELMTELEKSQFKSNTEKCKNTEGSKKSIKLKESISLESKEWTESTSKGTSTTKVEVCLEDQSGKIFIPRNIKQERPPKIETSSKMMEHSTPPTPSLTTQQQVPYSEEEMKSKIKRESVTEAKLSPPPSPTLTIKQERDSREDVKCEVKRESETKAYSLFTIGSKKPKTSVTPVIEITIDDDDSPVHTEEHEPNNSTSKAGTANKQDCSNVTRNPKPEPAIHERRNRETHSFDPRIRRNEYKPVLSAFALDRLLVSKTDKPLGRSICHLQAIDGYIYVSCIGGTVKRYNIHNSNDMVEYKEHEDAVLTLMVDSKRKLLLTGSKSGYLRCFDLIEGNLIGSKSVYSQIQAIVEAWNRIFVALKDGTVIQLKFQLSGEFSERLSETNEKFKVKEGIISIHPLLHGSDKKLVIMPINSRPIIVNAMSGVVYKTLDEGSVTFFPAFILSHDYYCLTVKGIESKPQDYKESVILVYNISRDWQWMTREFQRGMITAAHINQELLYVAILIRGSTRIHCYSIPDLRIIWMTYFNAERVFGLTVDDPYIFVGSESGEISSFSPDRDGPFPCNCPKCSCGIPFARKCDLKTHAKICSK